MGFFSNLFSEQEEDDCEGYDDAADECDDGIVTGVSVMNEDMIDRIRIRMPRDLPGDTGTMHVQSKMDVTKGAVRYRVAMTWRWCSDEEPWRDTYGALHCDPEGYDYIVMLHYDWDGILSKTYEEPCVLAWAAAAGNGDAREMAQSCLSAMRSELERRYIFVDNIID